jgi:6-pyruvoyl-tetrahydropterin synthase related domain
MALSVPKNGLRYVFLLAVLSVAAMLPAYYYGVPSGNDQSQHFHFAETVHRSIVSGEIYPSVAGETNHGFGDVGLRFYPPLTYYALSLVYLLLGDWYFACLAVFSLVFFAGAVGVYLWAREEFGREQALLAAALYTFAPYHLNLVYNNCLLAEFASTAVLPFCFLFLTRVCRRRRWADTFALAVAYALLILTHLPMTIIGSLALGVYGLLLLRRASLVWTLKRLVSTVLLALLMTSFYWLRMLTELDWVKHSTPKYFAETWSYGNNFLLLPSHFINFGEDVLNLWLADIMLAAVLLVSIPSFFYVFRNFKDRSRVITAAGGTLGVAVFMTTPLSSVVWRNLHFLQKVQFPWRWLSAVTAVGAIFASMGIWKASRAMSTGKNLPAAIGLGFVLVVFVFTGAFIVKGPVYLQRAQVNAMFTDIHDTNGCDCWWPVWAEQAAFGQKEKVLAPGRTVLTTEWEPTSINFELSAGEATIVRLGRFYYPHWHAFINGREVPVDKDENGTMTIAAPAESSGIQLFFREPTYVRAGYVVSIISWLVTLALFGTFITKRQSSGPQPVSF